MDNIMERLNQLESAVHEMQQMMVAFKIDRQRMIEREKRIKAGMGCKIAYNSDGLIVDSKDLEPSDIPSLPISKVKGLEDLLSDLVSSAQLKTIQDRLDTIYSKSEVIKTGTKVNVDKHGFIVDVASLIPEDIPMLPIDKIDGLQDILNQLSVHQPALVNDTNDYIPAGSGCKVNYDNRGRVISTEPLSIEDIPHSIITRLSELESALTSIAQQSDIDILKKMISSKAEQITTIPGIFSKVQIDSNGNVLSGEELTKDDLPIFTIDDIEGLRKELSQLGLHKDIIEIKNLIDNINSRINSIQEPNIPEQKDYTPAIEELSTKLDRATSDTSTKEELKEIRTQLASIVARLNILEK